MNRKQTPGPWHNVQDRTGDPKAIYAVDGEVVAEYVHNPADASLIAAAPDMLAALREFERLGAANLWDELPAEHNRAKAMVAARAAIAKATKAIPSPAEQSQE